MRRTRRTTPRNVRPGSASTVNETPCPARTEPTSASFTDAQMRIARRSLATRKSELTLMDETTVCPRFTRRSTTTPSTGETIVQ